MKILIATGIFTPELGGPATYAPKIAQEFLAKGHQVAVLTYSDTDDFVGDSALKYPVYRIKRTWKPVNFWRYYQKLRYLAQNYDLIYAFDHFSAGLPAAQVASQSKKPLYFRVGGDFIWERFLDTTKQMVTLRQFYYQGLHTKYEKTRFRIIKWVFARATGIIFTTSWQQDVFKKYYGLSKDKLHIVTNPIDSSQASLPRDKVNKEIIFAGRFITKNNIKKLIEAFVRVNDRDLSLAIIGDGPLKPELEYIIANYPEKHIKLTGKLSREDLAERISNAYLVVFPSLTDISPNLMLECLALGVPFISTVEIGFNWLKKKVRLFDPLEVSEISQQLNELSKPEAYVAYQKQINSIEYNYSYSRAAADTIKIFEQK